jgi:hypothetical protein
MGEGSGGVGARIRGQIVAVWEGSGDFDGLDPPGGARKKARQAEAEVRAQVSKVAVEASPDGLHCGLETLAPLEGGSDGDRPGGACGVHGARRGHFPSAVVGAVWDFESSRTRLCWRRNDSRRPAAHSEG